MGDGTAAIAFEYLQREADRKKRVGEQRRRKKRPMVGFRTE